MKNFAQEEKVLTFDMEIATVVPEGEEDWWKFRPLGISCAATQTADGTQVWYNQDGGPLTREAAQGLVDYLLKMDRRGYKITTWNGLSFDFRLLADESGMHGEVAELALRHVDLMFIVVCYRGHYLGLQAASRGAGIKGKLTEVMLNDGSYITDMDGARAPELWAAGEYNAVLTYLRQDVNALYKLANEVLKNGGIRWTSKKGRFNEIPFKHFKTVEECLAIPEPNTSWMSDPPNRYDALAWINGEQPLISEEEDLYQTQQDALGGIPW